MGHHCTYFLELVSPLVPSPPEESPLTLDVLSHSENESRLPAIPLAMLDGYNRSTHDSSSTADRI